MAVFGDAANFVLGGIPGDVHDLFVVDVEPGDLVRASEAMSDLGYTVRTVHVKLTENVTHLEGRWEGAGATAFQTDIWQPLSEGLGVLERESHNAAAQLTRLAAQAERAHLQKVMALNQEMQNQLELTAATWTLTPAAGKAISAVLGNVASRLGGELVSRVIAGIVGAIEDLISKVLAAFAKLFEWFAGPLATYATDISGQIGRILGIGPRLEQPGSGRALSTDADSVNLASPERTNHILNGDAKGGGHLWPGRPGKSPFPAGWSPDKIMNSAADIATDPNATVISQVGRRTVIVGERDGIRILVVTDGNDIITAYPTNLPTNP
jgi:uncharacterized protein YukE